MTAGWDGVASLSSSSSLSSSHRHAAPPPPSDPVPSSRQQQQQGGLERLPLENAAASHTKDRTILLVKCTDTSLNAFNDSLAAINALKRSDGGGGSVSFTIDGGVLKLPAKPSAGNPDVFKSLSFKINKLDYDGLQCLYQTPNKPGRPRRVVTCGDIGQTVRICATDEIFQQTRHKMNLAEEELKKNSTIPMQSNYTTKLSGKKGAILHKSMKAAKPISSSNSTAGCAANQNTSAKHSSPLIGPSKSSLSSNQRRSAPPVNQSASSNAPHNPIGSRHHTSPTKPGLHKHTVPPPASTASLAPASVGSTSGSERSASERSENDAHPDPRNFPLRTHVMHLLAIDAATVPSLRFRLSGLGIPADSMPANPKLKEALDQVARVDHHQQPKTYSLKKELVPELKLDYPFYSPTQRQLVHKNLEKWTSSSNSTQQRTNEPSINASGGGGAPDSQSKLTNGHSGGRDSLGHFEQPAYTTDQLHAIYGQKKPESHQPSSRYDHSQRSEKVPDESVVFNKRLKLDDGSAKPVNTLLNDKAEDGVVSRKECKLINNMDQLPANVVNSLQLCNPNCRHCLEEPLLEDTDYKMEFPEITSAAQFEQYVRLFDREYEEALVPLLNTVKKTKATFNALKTKYQHAKADSARNPHHFDQVAEEVITVYRKLFIEEDFFLTNHKCNQLHNRLKFLLSRIKAYKQQQQEQLSAGGGGTAPAASQAAAAAGLA